MHVQVHTWSRVRSTFFCRVSQKRTRLVCNKLAIDRGLAGSSGLPKCRALPPPALAQILSSGYGDECFLYTTCAAACDQVRYFVLFLLAHKSYTNTW